MSPKIKPNLQIYFKETFRLLILPENENDIKLDISQIPNSRHSNITTVMTNTFNKYVLIVHLTLELNTNIPWLNSGNIND